MQIFAPNQRDESYNIVSEYIQKAQIKRDMRLVLNNKLVNLEIGILREDNIPFLLYAKLMCDGQKIPLLSKRLAESESL